MAVGDPTANTTVTVTDDDTITHNADNTITTNCTSLTPNEVETRRNVPSAYDTNFRSITTDAIFVPNPKLIIIVHVTYSKILIILIIRMAITTTS